MRVYKQLFRPNLRLILFAVLAFAVYFAVVSSVPRDLEVKQAVENGDFETIRRLAWWFPSTIRHNRETDSILLDAIDQRQDNVELIEAILIANPDLGRQGENGRVTPLTVALESGQDRIARTLLDAGAAPNELGASGLAPLQCVARRCQNNLEMVDLLLDRGADSSMETPDGLNFVQTLVSYNSSKDTLSILKRLQERGLLDLGTTDEMGNTLLHLMCDVRPGYSSVVADLDVMQYLIDHGPHIEAKNKEGRTATLIAVATEVAKVSQKWSDAWRLIPIDEWEIKRIQFLIANGASVDFGEDAMSQIFAERPRASGVSETEPIYAATRARAGGVTRYYWFGGYPGNSVWIYQGQLFRGRQASGLPFALAHPEKRRSIPVIPEDEWDSATIHFDRETETVRCSIGEYWVEFDLGQSRPPVWSYRMQTPVD